MATWNFENAQQNITWDAGMAVVRGDVPKMTNINKFGYNGQVGNTTFETIWDGNNNYTYIATADVAQATSDAAATADDGATVLVSGLDANYNEVEETLTVGGVAGTVEFYRIFRAVLQSHPTGDTNIGDITVTCDSKSAAIIKEGYGQTLMALYTVPAGKRGYVVQVDAGSAKDLEHEIRLVIKHNGGVWNTKMFFTARGGFSAVNFKLPLYIHAEADIEIQARASATSAVSAGFEIIIEED